MPSDDARPRVLVIDGDEYVREGVRETLARQGFQIATAKTGPAGLKLLERREIDLILMDLHPPGRPSGLALLARLVEAEPERPVIVLAGQTTIEDAVAAIKAGAHDIVTKPFPAWQLERAVERALEALRLRRERERLKAERERGLWAITTEKSRLRAVINSMGEGVLITDNLGAIILCNPAFIRLMGLGKDCVIGATMDEVPELAPLTELADEFGGKAAPRAITKEIVVEGRRRTYLRATMSRVSAGDEEALGLVAVLRDITPIKELEQKKADFVAMVTHELRAPLAAVDTQLHVLLKGLAGRLTKKQKELLTKIQARIGGGLELISNLLDLAKIESQSFVQEKVLTDINPIIREVVDTLEAQAEEKGLTIALYLKPDLPQVLADPAGIREVIMNLVSNSIRYTLPDGLIEITSGLDAGYVHFTVADTGIGIPEEDLDKIFDRFYRVKSEKTRHVVGTGLGLPIVEAIVKDHLGYVRVASQPDEGTVFRIMLPAVD